jgi:adenylyltransferase/sulfurtransferase
MDALPELSVLELAAELSSGSQLVLLDVRESDELEVSRLSQAVHVPLGELPDRIGQIERQADIVVICRTGGRSAQAAEFLLGSGFHRVRNLRGGMNAWAIEIDPSLPVD